MKIYLISNCESENNENEYDHKVDLSSEGSKHAKFVGVFIANKLKKISWNGNVHGRIWYSPYLTSKRTKDIIVKTLKEYGLLFNNGCYESASLANQQRGLFDGVASKDVKIVLDQEYYEFKYSLDDRGEFWTQYPRGESAFNVTQRVQQMFKTIHHDKEHHGIDLTLIISHDIVIRSFIMMWLHKTVEWFENEPIYNPGSIQMIDCKKNCNCIFEGF